MEPSLPRLPGGCRLSVALGLFSLRSVGWLMAAKQDAALVEQALQMALAHRKPQAGLLHLADRGCPYTSEADQAVRQRNRASRSAGVARKMSGTMPSSSAALGRVTRECTSRAHFATHEQARSALFESIECFSNRVRKHSPLGYLSPVHFE